jgi:hypothetical protein
MDMMQFKTILRYFISAIFFVILSIFSAMAESFPKISNKDIDPIFVFYFNKADSVFNNFYVFNSSKMVIFEVRAVYLQTDYRGKPNKIDTAVYEITFADAKFSVQKIIDSAKINENVPPEIPKFELPWTFNYRFNLYPNDTGAGEIAIGFEHQQSVKDPALEGDKSGNPIGLFTIDRDNYALMRLAREFPRKRGYKSYSETYQFEVVGNIITLKMTEYTYSISGLFDTKYIKHRFDFYDYQIK